MADSMHQPLPPPHQNPTEWMGTAQDCCACWFDDSTYLKEALSLTPAYLRGTGNLFDYKVCRGGGCAWVDEMG